MSRTIDVPTLIAVISCLCSSWQCISC